MKIFPVVMTIAGSDSGGGAGIQADLATFAMLNAHGTCAITSVTSQNTRGVSAIHDLPADTIISQIMAVASDMNIVYAKTGMLFNSDIIQAAARTVKKCKIPLVVDPVMAAEAGGSLLRSEAVDTLQEELIPLSRVVTPNISEAEVLSGITICDWHKAAEAARRIIDFGANAVIITGGHLDGSDLLYDGFDDTLIKGELIKGGTHGAGCTYSAALTVFLAQGAVLKDAATAAKSFVTRAIMHSRSVGHGAGPVNPAGYTLQHAYHYEAMADVAEAVKTLETSDCFTDLIPEVGCNIASAIPGAAGMDEVCAIRGRIVKLEDRAYAVGCPAFGASSHVARIVLAAMHHDPQIKAAMNIRYSKDILQVIRDMGFEVAFFDREHEPPGVTTMEWGTDYAIKNYKHTHNRIPDAIYDLGAVAKEPMIRLLSQTAVDIARMAVQISKVL
jgi:hydroxymethylpyrimidine kinase/phosphomethylpyrimidine kinase